MFCPKCGKQLPDGAKFCSGCGSVLSAPKTELPKPRPEQSPVQRGPEGQRPPPGRVAAPGNKGILGRGNGVCPNCGSHDCEVQVQQNVTTSGSNYSCCSGGLGWLLVGPFGLLCGLCGSGKKTTTTSKSIWLCKKCGTQFPTRKELAAKLFGYLALLSIWIPICIGAAIASFGIGVQWAMLMFLALAAVLVYAGWRTLKKYIGDCPLNDAVVNGLLTDQEFKSTKTICLVCFIIGLAILIFCFWVINFA